MKRTKEEAGETKQKIIDAAVELFETNGYNATRIEDIAEKTGMTRGAVYWHFKNKDELYTYILEMFEQRLDLLLTESLNETRSPLERLRWLMIKSITRSNIRAGIGQIQRIIISNLREKEIPEMLHKAHTIFGKYKHTIENIIEAGITAGEINKSVDVDNASIMISVFVTGAVGVQVDKLQLSSVHFNTDEIVDLVLNGIRM
jgi:TetR/AcrR family transcriptional regulator, acrAB operon repressor